MAIEQCPVCRLAQFKLIGESDNGNKLHIDCAICGRYVIGKMAAFRLKSMAKPDFRISAWIRRANLRHPEQEVVIVQNELEDILASLPSIDVGDRPTALLEAIAIQTTVPGQAVTAISAADFPWASASNSDEFEFHLAALEEGGLVSVQRNMAAESKVVVTHAGWQLLRSKTVASSPTAFVAMSFSEDLLPIWSNGIRQGILAAGYDPRRVDTQPHIERIDLKMLGDIRAARFIVADVTQQKQGVYFEAGFALALGRPVIWTVRKDEIDSVHFDTRQFVHILWTDAGDFKEQLTGVIRGVIGQGPLNV